MSKATMCADRAVGGVDLIASGSSKAVARTDVRTRDSMSDQVEQPEFGLPEPEVSSSWEGAQPHVAGSAVALSDSTRENEAVNFLDYEERPWGSYTVLRDEADHKVKSILVTPGSRISYQTHARRSEHWFVVRGEGSVRLDGIDHIVGPGSTIDVAQGVAHRIQNTGTDDLIFIEVQHGDYFGEDDIIRLDDDFGRV